MAVRKETFSCKLVCKRRFGAAEGSHAWAKRVQIDQCQYLFNNLDFGEMAEWLKAHAWKACVVAILPQVRILFSPPNKISYDYYMDKKQDFQELLSKYFQKISKKSGPNQPLQVLVNSDKLGIDFNYSNTDIDQPFHIASIGKIFTAVVIGILSDKSAIKLDDKITQYLDEKVLEKLFVYQNVDYKDQVTIKDLLGHTSGISDYFDSSVTAGSKFIDKIMKEPDVLWTPESLVDFTRNNQKAVSAPGKFQYSDTGYILLGLLIEKVTGKSFGDNLKTLIFDPLAMSNSYLMFYSDPQPTREIAKIWFNGVDISKLNLLSCDWAGGGIVSTTQDLLKFQKAFRSGHLVSSNYLRQMDTFEHKYRSGIYYGFGMMELRLEGFFFLLRGLPRPRGHIGITSTHLFYDIDNDVHIIMNFGSNKRMVESFKSLIIIEQYIKQYLKKEHSL